MDPDAENGGGGAPKVDLFGVERRVEPVEAPAADKKEDEKDVTIPAAKADWKAGDPIEVHPTVVGLMNDIKKVKDEYGGNLSGQRDKIEKLEDELAKFKGGKGKDGKSAEEKPAVEVPYKDIKKVADLPKEEQEAMTETEKRLWDDNAAMKERENARAVADAERAGEADQRTVDQFNATAQAAALKLAGNDKEVANSILREFNQFEGNDKLTTEQIAERMEKATKLVSGYKPPKEQSQARGGAVKKGTNDADPFGVDKFIDEASASKSAGAFPL